MNDGQLRREALFIASMEFFGAMLAKGIITDAQFKEMQRRMAEKYLPPIGILSLTD